MSVEDKIWQLKGWNRDVLFQKVAAHIPDNLDIVFKPTGSFKKGYATNINDIILKAGKVILHLNREGIYDILPKRLFHEISDQNMLIGNKDFDDYFSRIEEEEKNARIFFQPFDSEIFSVFHELEKERISYENSFFSDEVAIEYLQFYDLMRQIGYFQVLELMIEEYEADLKGFLMQNELTFRDVLKFVININKNDNPLSRFVSSLPLAQSAAGDLSATRKILTWILGEEVSVEAVDEDVKYRMSQPENLRPLGEAKLGNGTITGENVVIQERVCRFTLRVSNPYRIPLFINNACFARLIQVFFSFFTPLFVIPKLIVTSKTGDAFILSEPLGKSTDHYGRSNLLNEIDKHFFDTDYDLDTRIPLNIKVGLSRYFSAENPALYSAAGSYLASDTVI